MVLGCEEIAIISGDFPNKLVLSKKNMPLKTRESLKKSNLKHLTEKVAVPDLLSSSALYLWCHIEKKYYRRKNFHTITMRVWCGTH